jgi:hypothetical protein
MGGQEEQQQVSTGLLLFFSCKYNICYTLAYPCRCVRWRLSRTDAVENSFMEHLLLLSTPHAVLNTSVQAEPVSPHHLQHVLFAGAAACG